MTSPFRPLPTKTAVLDGAAAGAIAGAALLQIPFVARLKDTSPAAFNAILGAAVAAVLAGKAQPVDPQPGPAQTLV